MTVLSAGPERRLFWTVSSFLRSEVRWRARGMLALLVLLPVAISGLNVANSYMNRDFMTAIEQRHASNAVRFAVLYVGSFGALTVAAVFLRFTEERLGLLWRTWLTSRLVTSYFSERTFLWMKAGERLDNPDQRITEDVRTFVATSISFLLIVLNSVFAIIAFAGVLWSIRPVLLMAAVGCALFGSLMTMVLGWRLARLNSRQYDREADLRSALIHVRENAESIALIRCEDRQRGEAIHLLEALVANFRRITSVNRNVGFFTTSYNYLVQVLPVLIVAPLYFEGSLQFGVITQSVIAFGHVSGAVSLIITQFNALSSYAAVIGRLSALGNAIESADAARTASIEIVEEQGQLRFERLTLTLPELEKPLVENLSLSCIAGSRLLVTGSNELGRLALFRAAAGLWPHGRGSIFRPPLDELAFVPQRPYLARGTLRQVLVCSESQKHVVDDAIRAALGAVKLDKLPERFGGLDQEQDWTHSLSLGEQQRLMLAAVILAAPRFALLDRVHSIVGADQMPSLLEALERSSITPIVFAEPAERKEGYDAVLQLTADGRWTLQTLSQLATA